MYSQSNGNKEPCAEDEKNHNNSEQLSDSLLSATSITEHYSIAAIKAVLLGLIKAKPTDPSLGPRILSNLNRYFTQIELHPEDVFSDIKFLQRLFEQVTAQVTVEAYLAKFSIVSVLIDIFSKIEKLIDYYIFFSWRGCQAIQDQIIALSQNETAENVALMLMLLEQASSINRAMYSEATLKTFIANVFKFQVGENKRMLLKKVTNYIDNYTVRRNDSQRISSVQMLELSTRQLFYDSTLLVAACETADPYPCIAYLVEYFSKHLPLRGNQILKNYLLMLLREKELASAHELLNLAIKKSHPFFNAETMRQAFVLVLDNREVLDDRDVEDIIKLFYLYFRKFNVGNSFFKARDFLGEDELCEKICKTSQPHLVVYFVSTYQQYLCESASLKHYMRTCLSEQNYQQIELLFKAVTNLSYTPLIFSYDYVGRVLHAAISTQNDWLFNAVLDYLERVTYKRFVPGGPFAVTNSQGQTPLLAARAAQRWDMVRRMVDVSRVLSRGAVDDIGCDLISSDVEIKSYFSLQALRYSIDEMIEGLFQSTEQSTQPTWPQKLSGLVEEMVKEFFQLLVQGVLFLNDNPEINKILYEREFPTLNSFLVFYIARIQNDDDFIKYLALINALLKKGKFDLAISDTLDREIRADFLTFVSADSSGMRTFNLLVQTGKLFGTADDNKILVRNQDAVLNNILNLPRDKHKLSIIDAALSPLYPLGNYFRAARELSPLVGAGSFRYPSFQVISTKLQDERQRTLAVVKGVAQGSSCLQQ